MPKYRVNRVKPTSLHRRYEWVRQNWEKLRTQKLKGQELDEYIDEQIWREAHPGEEPIEEWGDGVPTK